VTHEHRHASDRVVRIDNMDGTTLFDDGQIKVIHGDALAVLRDLDEPVHAMVTDPPYASGARTEAKKVSSGAMLRGGRFADKPIENDQMTSTGFVWLVRETCYAVRDHLVDGGAVLSFIDWRQWPNLVGAIETTNLRVNGMLVWDKMGMGLGNGFRSQHELIAYASKGTARVIDKGVGNVFQFKREKPVDHPSPKPVALMERLIRTVTEPGDLIVDPFMGAGATLVAAKNTGRRAIGVEVHRKYADVAVRRLSESNLFEGSA
jgi:site-specific DNA-methyltransferase (adenine-specific)